MITLIRESSREICRELGAEAYVRRLCEGLRQGAIVPRTLDLEEEFDAILGGSWKSRVFESSDVLTSDFPYAMALGREVMETAIRDAYEIAPTPVHRLLTERRITGPGIDGGWEHQIVSQSFHESSLVNEYQEGVTQSLSEFAVMRPPIRFRHRTISLTRETRLRDDLNVVTEAASRIGEEMAYEAERDCLTQLLGLTSSYQDNVNGAAGSYQTGTPWDNVVSGQDIEDVDGIDAIREKLAGIRHPATNRTLNLQWRMKHLLTMPQRYARLRGIVSATEITNISNGGNRETKLGNPYLTQFSLLADSALAYDLLIESGVEAEAAKTYVFCGDFSLALRRAVADPLTVTQREGDWRRRIDVAWEATWAYVHYPVMPQAIIKSFD